MIQSIYHPPLIHKPAQSQGRTHPTSALLTLDTSEYNTLKVNHMAVYD